MKIDFLFFYDIVNRELESIILLKKILEKRGYSCAISNTHSWGILRNIFLTEPAVIVVPWLRHDDNVYIFTRFLRKKRYKLVNLQFEQIYNKEWEKNGLVQTTGFAKNAFHFCWGERGRSRLLQQGLDEDLVKISGPIHMDFCRPEFSPLLMKRDDLAHRFSLDLNLKWRLFISNLAYASKTPQLFKSRRIDVSGWVDIHIQTRDIILEWYRNLLDSRRDEVVIYRPHPIELVDEKLKNLEMQYSNFHIIGSLPIKNWIMAADSIDVWNSTSIADAHFCKKKCNILRPVEIPDNYNCELYENAKVIRNYSEFSMSLDSVVEESIPIEDYRSYYDFDDNRFSSERAADLLEEVYRGKIDFDYKHLIPRIINRKYFIPSLAGDLALFGKMRISKIVPLKRQIFENAENVALEFSERCKEIEGQIEKIVIENLK